jgi:hypothetical protein
MTSEDTTQQTISFKIPAMYNPVLFVTSLGTLLPENLPGWNVKRFTQTVTRPDSTLPYEKIIIVLEDTLIDSLDGFGFINMLTAFSKQIGLPVTLRTHTLMHGMYDSLNADARMSDTHTTTIGGRHGAEDAIHVELFTKDAFAGGRADGYEPVISLLGELGFDFDFEAMGITDLRDIPTDLVGLLWSRLSHRTVDYAVLMGPDDAGKAGITYVPIGKH